MTCGASIANQFASTLLLLSYLVAVAVEHLVLVQFHLLLCTHNPLSGAHPHPASCCMSQEASKGLQHHRLLSPLSCIIPFPLACAALPRQSIPCPGKNRDEPVGGEQGQEGFCSSACVSSTSRERWRHIVNRQCHQETKNKCHVIASPLALATTAA